MGVAHNKVLKEIDVSKFHPPTSDERKGSRLLAEMASAQDETWLESGGLRRLSLQVDGISILLIHDRSASPSEIGFLA